MEKIKDVFRVDKDNSVPGIRDRIKGSIRGGNLRIFREVINDAIMSENAKTYEAVNLAKYEELIFNEFERETLLNSYGIVLSSSAGLKSFKKHNSFLLYVNIYAEHITQTKNCKYSVHFIIDRNTLFEKPKLSKEEILPKDYFDNHLVGKKNFICLYSRELDELTYSANLLYPVFCEDIFEVSKEIERIKSKKLSCNFKSFLKILDIKNKYTPTSESELFEENFINNDILLWNQNTLNSYLGLWLLEKFENYILDSFTLGMVISFLNKLTKEPNIEIIKIYNSISTKPLHQCEDIRLRWDYPIEVNINLINSIPEDKYGEFVKVVKDYFSSKYEKLVKKKAEEQKKAQEIEQKLSTVFDKGIEFLKAAKSIDLDGLNDPMYGLSDIIFSISSKDESKREVRDLVYMALSYRRRHLPRIPGHFGGPTWYL